MKNEVMAQIRSMLDAAFVVETEGVEVEKSLNKLLEKLDDNLSDIGFIPNEELEDALEEADSVLGDFFKENEEDDEEEEEEDFYNNLEDDEDV